MARARRTRGCAADQAIMRAVPTFHCVLIALSLVVPSSVDANSASPQAGFRLVGSSGLLQQHVHEQQQQQPQPQPQQTHGLSRSLRHSAAVVTTESVVQPQPPPPPAAAAAPTAFGRTLKQFAGLANFAAGAGVTAAQRAINAGGALAQLSNFYGLEGVGLRHRLGALPGPGGLQLLLLAGPKALPGPEGFTAGFIGGTVEALAATANPINAAAIGSVLKDAAASSGLGQLIGATGFSGLGLQSGGAAMLADKVAGGSLLSSQAGKLGLKPPLAGLAQQGNLLGEQGQVNAGVQGDVGPGVQGNVGLGVQGNLGTGVQQANTGISSMQGGVAIASTPGYAGTSSNGYPAAAGAAGMMPEAGQLPVRVDQQPAAATAVTRGQQQAGGQTAGVATAQVSSGGPVGSIQSQGFGQVPAVPESLGQSVSGVGGMFKSAGRFLGKLTGKKGSAAAAGSGINTVETNVQAGGGESKAGPGSDDMVSVTPGYNGGSFVPSV